MAGTVTLALAGDTMLGRGVAAALERDPRAPLFAREVVEAAAEADRFILNLECAISERGERFRDPRKPFFFRAPPVAAERLAEAGVDAVTLANNHALDFGPVALLDTLDHLAAAGVAAVGAGAGPRQAREPLRLAVGDVRLRLVALTDHPKAYGAGPGRPGVAFADLASGRLPRWVTSGLARGDDIVVALPHWGPNMCQAPLPYIRQAARELVAAGAALVAGHSAHVFQGVCGRVLFDLGDFLDDYATDASLRNDLGALWLVTLDAAGPQRIEALPLRLEFCRTRLATGADADWIARRLTGACARLGTTVSRDGDRLVIAPRADTPRPVPGT